MLFYEFATIKPIKPLTPAQARITFKKRQVDQARDALKRERETQKQQREREQQAKQLRKR